MAGNGAPRESDALWIARCLGKRDFTLLAPEDVEALSGVIRPATVPAGSALFRQGERATCVQVVRDGEVDLIWKGAGRTVHVGIARSGEAVGDIAALCENPYPFSAIAREPVTTIRIDRDDLLGLLRRHPAIALRWLMSVIERMDRTTSRILELAQRDPDSRIRAFLAGEVRARGEEAPVTLRLSQAAIASLSGTTRQSANKVLRALEKSGCIRLGYRKIQILEPGRLTVTV